MNHQPNPDLDLVLERVVDVPKELVWKAWTTPDQILQWFTPDPWKTIECKIDLQPGGRFYTVMQSPEGEKFPNEGCYLEVVENQKLIWTSVLLPGYRPNPEPEAGGCGALHFTAVITLEDHPEGTKYKAIAIHGDHASQKRHSDMGFHDGWGTVLDQMVAMIKSP